MSIPTAIAGLAPALTAIRRDLHRHPELAFEETRTAEIVARELTAAGIEVVRGIARTGVVGTLRAGSSDNAIALRADMNCLPLAELNEFAHRSSAQGRMHACGHDGHTTMLLGAARPGAYIFIGNGAGEGSCMLHNPRYDFNDEILTLGAAYWVSLVEQELS